MKNKLIFIVLILNFISINSNAQFKINSANELKLSLPNESDWASSIETIINNDYAKCYVVNNNGNHTFYVRGDGYIIARGTWINSDKNFKSDIKAINLQKLKSLYQLNAKSYIYKSDKNFNLPKDNIATKRQIGFIAQDVEHDFPELVLKDEKGMRSINYTGFTPIIIEALKTQQKQIETLQEVVKQQEEDLTKLKNAKKTTKAGTRAKNAPKSQNTKNKGNLLFQNAPNPFSATTMINYSITKDFHSANLYIFNLQGNEVKSYPLSKAGSGSIRIQASELKAGMYIYSLVVDGKIIDTKRMILTNK